MMTTFTRVVICRYLYQLKNPSLSPSLAEKKILQRIQTLYGSKIQRDIIQCINLFYLPWKMPFQ
jgi:hypothetical protein